MTRTTVFHVVTERPMSVGQRIVFDEGNRSGVWRRVHERAEEAARIQDDPAAYEGVELDHHLAVALRELAMEEVRVRDFPALPSRMASLYVSRTREDAEAWCGLFIGWGRPTHQIVRMEIDGAVFAGDARNCFAGTVDRDENLRLAARYWRNLPNPGGEEPITEVLAAGAIEVVEIVREVGANLPE